MKCKKCDKIIEDYEIYCDDCKELLKKEKELDKLIMENKELNKLEITKEVDTLQNFKDEKQEDSLNLKDELKDLVNIEELEYSLKEKDNKKTLIIVIISGVLLFIIAFIILVLFNNNEEPSLEENEVINYEEVLDDYGKTISKTILEYLNVNNQLPSWSAANDLINYNKHEVICDVHNLYEDGTIYLDKCTIDGNSVDYFYGEEKTEEKKGRIMEIYKKEEDNYYSYTIENQGLLELVGSITCKTDKCEYVKAYDKYVIIKEESDYYLYNYLTNTVEFGPFKLGLENPNNTILTYENNLYGILYKEIDKLNLYNAQTGKTLKNLDGELLMPLSNFIPNIMYKYGYVILKNGSENNFINLKTGNISYSIEGSINSFIEDNKNNITYITTINLENSKITIYNSNGKKLFNGREYNDIQISNDKLIVASDSNFYIYNSKLKLDMTSKEYNVLGLYDGFVAVINNEYLEIVDYNDQLIYTFDLKWNYSEHSIDSNLSGMNNNEIKLFIHSSNNNKLFEYYYNLLEREAKVVEINN